MRTARSAGLAATAVAAILVGGCGGPDAGRSASPPTTTALAGSATSATSATKDRPSKLPAAVQAVVARLRAGERATGASPTFADTGVAVRDDGRVHLELHAAGALADSAAADVTALGAEVVSSLSRPATPAAPAIGVVDAWVPFARVDDAAALPWVVAVTAASTATTSS